MGRREARNLLLRHRYSLLLIHHACLARHWNALSFIFAKPHSPSKRERLPSPTLPPPLPPRVFPFHAAFHASLVLCWLACLVIHIRCGRAHVAVDLRPLTVCAALAYCFEIWTFFQIYGMEGAYPLAYFRGSTWTGWVEGEGRKCVIREWGGRDWSESTDSDLT